MVGYGNFLESPSDYIMWLQGQGAIFFWENYIYVNVEQMLLKNNDRYMYI